MVHRERLLGWRSGILFWDVASAWMCIVASPSSVVSAFFSVRTHALRVVVWSRECWGRSSRVHPDMVVTVGAFHCSKGRTLSGGLGAQCGKFVRLFC